jgi:ArsR family transcriptional regulator
LEHIAKQSEVGCRRLCGCFPVRQATISHHLKELASAGLVESRRDGQVVYYRLRPAVFETYMAELRRKMAVHGDGKAKVTVHADDLADGSVTGPAARTTTARRKPSAAKQSKRTKHA